MTTDNELRALKAWNTKLLNKTRNLKAEIRSLRLRLIHIRNQIDVILNFPYSNRTIKQYDRRKNETNK